jgi:hypothetical protein
MRLFLVLGMLFCAGTAAASEPAPPTSSADFASFSVGVLCSPRVADRSAAPDTRLGYTNVVAAPRKIGFAQQKVPATLGVSFGVMFTPTEALTGVRNVTYRPGSTKPDVYYTDIEAKPGRYRGFAFEYQEELVPGLWRMESWQGDKLLYRVEFQVVPEAALPEIQAQCLGMS